MPTIEKRRGPRSEVELPCTLARRHGNQISGVTQDIGPGGMCIVTDRPLRVDEELEFDLMPEAPGHPHGRALVVRQQRANCYALRFDQLIDDSTLRRYITRANALAVTNMKPL